VSENHNTVRKSFSFDALRDHDILEWLSGQDNTSEVARAAFRKYMGQPSQSDVMNRIDELTSKVSEVLHELRSIDVREHKREKETGNQQAKNNLLNMVNRWNE